MKSFLKQIRELDSVSRFIVIFLAIIFSYILIICIAIPLLLSPTNGFSEEYILSFGTPKHRHLNLISFLIAVLIGGVFAILIRPKTNEDHQEMTILKNVLSASDKQVVEIIDEAGEITQDSLTFRLEWSRAKVSTILTNLEKRNIIQRRREGKTYVVFLAKQPNGN